MFAGKYQSYLVRWNALFVLDPLFRSKDGLPGLEFNCDRFACEGFNKGLATTTSTIGAWIVSLWRLSERHLSDNHFTLDPFHDSVIGYHSC